MMGILAGQKFLTTFTGDASLSRRPMGRVINPLSQMGANIVGRKENKLLPITVIPAKTSLRSVKSKTAKQATVTWKKAKSHQRLSDQLQSEQQHEKGESPYRKRFCYTRNLKETGFKEKILCTDPHLQSCKRQKILFQMEFQKIRKN